MAKKKIVYHSDFSLINTGFGKAARLILTHLYKTGKYEIVHFCCGLTKDHVEFSRLPWKSIGALPEAHQHHNDPRLAQMASYGAFTIDDVMKSEKPDIYIGVQDIWGCDFAIGKSWFTPSNMAIWTTLDSLPILPSAIKAASETENFWCWSDFATKSLHKLGNEHVKTIRGPLDTQNFRKVNQKINFRNRRLFGIPEEAYVIGFVFRNQLRKSVPNLLEGYKLFTDQNPEVKTKLLLHTNFSEGWGIHKLADEIGVDKEDILTSYACSSCGSYGVHNFQGQELDCPYCKTEKSYNTTGVQAGVSEKQLNEIYNLMDVYCHPFTSGGQEIPIQEAKLAEKVTLVTNYSCGEDNCTPESASVPLEWSRYREHGTEFIKASTSSESIAQQLKHVYDMPAEEREKMGQEARQWVINNFSIKKIGESIEEFIDSAPVINKKKVYSKPTNQNPEAEIDSNLPDEEWVISLYKNILAVKVGAADEGVLYWMQEIKKGTPKNKIEDYFRNVAIKEKSGEKKGIEGIVSPEDKDSKKVMFVIPQSIGDVYLCTSLFPSLKKQYPDHKLYVATSPHFQGMILGNPYVDEIVDYYPEMEDVYRLEGCSNRNTRAHVAYAGKESLFDVVLLPYLLAQKFSCYTHNGKDEIAFDIRDFEKDI
tara:strand:- start:1186 stop:3132 length:1947 start_codon:yes stop_codon:yes gene_type:complete